MRQPYPLSCPEFYLQSLQGCQSLFCDNQVCEGKDGSPVILLSFYTGEKWMSVWLRLNCKHDYEAFRMNERTARPQVVPRALGAGICFHSTDSSLCLWFYSNPQFSSVQSLSRVQLFETPWTAACQASLSITNSRSLLKLMLIELVMPSNCHTGVCSSVLCLVTTKIWSDRR